MTYSTKPIDVINSEGSWLATFRFEPFLNKWFVIKESKRYYLSLISDKEVPKTIKISAKKNIANKNSDLLSYKAPVKIQIQINTNCNYKCSICFTDSPVSSDYNTSLSFENLCNFLVFIKDWGVLRVNFIGGEVFLRKDFPLIIKFCNQINLSASCITNARTVGSNIQKYRAVLDSLFYIQISCNGFGKSYTDEYGEKNWKKAKEAITNVIKASPFSILSYIIKDNNIKDIYNFIKFCDKVKPNIIKFGAVCSSGRAENKLGDFERYYNSTVAQARIIIDKLRLEYPYLNIQSQLDFKKNSPMSIDIKNNYRSLEFYLSPEGKDSIYIDANGRIYPFPLLADSNKYLLGNIFNHDIKKVWSNSPTLKKLREITFDDTKCGKINCSTPCGLWNRSYAIKWSGELLGKIPCHYDKPTL